MGGSSIQLAAYGNENEYIFNTSNVIRSMFYSMKIGHTNFAMETVSTSFAGKNQDLHMTKEVKLEVAIPRTADLLHKIYFAFDIPNVYTKEHPLRNPIIDPGNSTSDVPVNAQTNCSIMRWIDHLGAAMILSAQIEIGGKIVQELTGNMIDIYHHTRLDETRLKEYYEMIGHTPEMNDVSSTDLRNIYKRCSLPPSQTTPQNIRYINPTNGLSFLNPGYSQPPFIRGRRIYVPLPFWFHDNISQCLPLLTLDTTPVYLRMRLRPIQELYLTGALSQFQFTASSIAYNSAQNYVFETFFANANNNTIPRSVYPRGWIWAAPTRSEQELRFFTGLASNTWPLNPSLELTYVFLDKEQQMEFKMNSVQHLIDRVYTESFLGLDGGQSHILELSSTHLSREIFVVAQRDDIRNRNAWTNYTGHDEELKRESDLLSKQSNCYRLAVEAAAANALNIPTNTYRRDILGITTIPDSLADAQHSDVAHIILYDFGMFGNIDPYIALSNQIGLGLQTIYLDINAAYTFSDLQAWSDIWRFRGLVNIPAITSDNFRFYQTGIIQSMNLTFNGEPRQRDQLELYYSSIQPLQHHTASPDSNRHILMYSFADNPESEQPRGSANFTTLARKVINLTLKANAPEQQYRYDVTVFSITHQSILFIPGQGAYLQFGQ
jgi:hypothetical protein